MTTNAMVQLPAHTPFEIYRPDQFALFAAEYSALKSELKSQLSIVIHVETHFSNVREKFKPLL